MNKHLLKFALVLASVGWLGGANQSAYAEPMTLQDLLNGGSLVVGDKLYTNFSAFSSTGQSAWTVDPSKVFVIPTLEGGKLGLTFQGNGQFAVGPNQWQNTHFEFNIISRNTSIKSMTLELTASAYGGGAAQVTSMFNNELPGLSVRTSTPVNYAHNVFASPHDRAHIDIDIRLTGSDEPGLGRTVLDSFYLSVEQPEPGTLTLLGLGALGLLGYRWRRARS